MGVFVVWERWERRRAPTSVHPGRQGAARSLSPAATTQEEENLASTVVRHFLFSNSSRPGVPIPRADLLKLIKEESGRPGLTTSSFACVAVALVCLLFCGCRVR